MAIYRRSKLQEDVVLSAIMLFMIATWTDLMQEICDMPSLQAPVFSIDYGSYPFLKDTKSF